MKKIIFAIIAFFSIIMAGCTEDIISSFKDNGNKTNIAQGKVKISVNMPDMLLYLNGEKKSTVGKEYAIFFLDKGEHRLKVVKTIDDEWIWQGEKTIFVGSNSEISVHIEAKKKPTQKRLDKLTKKQEVDITKVIEYFMIDKNATHNIESWSKTSNRYVQLAKLPIQWLSEGLEWEENTMNFAAQRRGKSILKISGGPFYEDIEGSIFDSVTVKDATGKEHIVGFNEFGDLVDAQNKPISFTPITPKLYWDISVRGARGGYSSVFFDVNKNTNIDIKSIFENSDFSYKKIFDNGMIESNVKIYEVETVRKKKAYIVLQNFSHLKSGNYSFSIELMLLKPNNMNEYKY